MPGQKNAFAIAAAADFVDVGAAAGAVPVVAAPAVVLAPAAAAADSVAIP